jgi:hypothetical protein
MKTKGIEVLDGYLLLGFTRADGTRTPSPNWVPDAFWGRLKHAITTARLVDEFKADDATTREAPAMCGPLTPEQALFQRWHRRLGFVPPAGHYAGQDLWPWTRGWTEERVDAYLTQAQREAA